MSWCLLKLPYLQPVVIQDIVEPLLVNTCYVVNFIPDLKDMQVEKADIVFQEFSNLQKAGITSELCLVLTSDPEYDRGH